MIDTYYRDVDGHLHTGDLIDITTLGDTKRKVLYSRYSDGPLCILAVCVIVTDREKRISYNHCTYQQVSANCIKLVNGLQKMICKDSVTFLEEKDVSVRSRCFIGFSEELLSPYIEQWFFETSFSEEIDYRRNYV